MHQQHLQSQKSIMHFVLSKDETSFYKASYYENAQIGTGKFGTVYNASLKHSKTIQGASHIENKGDIVIKTATAGKEKYLLNEIKMLKTIPPHKNIVQFIGASLNNKHCVLEKCFFSFARKTSDYEIFKKMPLGIQFAIFHNMITSHLHLLKHDIKNIDVHLMNWLVGYDGHIKMIDFGDAYNMFNIPMKHIRRYKAKLSTKDPMIQIDILMQRLERSKVRRLLLALTKIVDLSLRQSLLIYFVNGGKKPEEYRDHFFKLHKTYTQKREKKFLKHFHDIKENYSTRALVEINAQIIKELEIILQSDYIWKHKASPEAVKQYFVELSGTDPDFYAAKL